MCATFVGTFKYMSPERIKNLTYGQPADIWSFGITLLECATGRYPYSESEYFFSYFFLSFSVGCYFCFGESDKD